MKVAVTAWEGRVSPVFDTAHKVLIYEVADGRAGPPSEQPLAEGPPEQRVSQVASLGIGALICGAISRPLASLARGAGIRLIPFVAGPVEEVLAAFLAGNLPSPTFGMPGCRGRRRRLRAGRGCGGARPPEG